MNEIYYKSPIFMQHLITSLYGLKLRRRRYNRLYRKYLQRYTNKEIIASDELEKILIHLKNNIPLYSELDITADKTFVIKKIPFTEKDDLRNELNLRSYTEGKIAVGKTGGTTGKSLKVYSNEYDRASRMAFLDYIKSVHGIKPFSKRASFTGKEIVPHNHKNILWRYNLVMHQVLYASFKINKYNVKYIFNNMKKYKPTTIDGFPSSIHLVAKYILLNNIEINWEVKAIFPTAERLTENMKEDIEKAFCTKVIDQYASSEGAPFIYINEKGDYEIANETGFFEFYQIKDDIYEMVVTSFINYATPIIRYKIGDNVQIKSNEKYLNSFENKVLIKKILGRNTDSLIGSKRNIVTSANMSNVVKDLGNKVIQSQFIQKEINKYIINLVVNSKFDKNIDQDIIIDKLNHRLGTSNKYLFNYVDEIPKEKSGKTRFIINEMSEKNGS